MTHESQRGDGPEERSEPDIQALEACLAALQPLDDRLDRETLMFLAGQASVGSGAASRRSGPRHWAWPASVGTAFGAAAAAIMLLARPVSTKEVATHPKQHEASAVAKSDPSTHLVPFDWASPQSLFVERRLTAGMALARTPRLFVAAEPYPAADETPTQAPATQPSLTTRSLREILATGPSGAFSS